MNGSMYRPKSGAPALTRTEWLSWILAEIPVPPPPSWVVSQIADKGRSEPSAYAIWHRSYGKGRKYVIWDQADQSDWDFFRA